MKTVVIGNPNNRRVALFQGALQAAGLSPARVVAYAELLRNSCDLALVLRGFTHLRIESPGEDFEVERELIALGAADGADFDAVAARRLEFEPGRIRHLKHWHRGFSHLLARIEAAAEAASLALYNTPAEIRLMFDKPRCQRRLAEAGAPVPAMIAGVESYPQLRDAIRERGWSRVFIKLAHGSSASGVVALYDKGETTRAVTSVELAGPAGAERYYNNLKLRTYTRRDDIRRVIEFLISEGAQVEQWLPKASLEGRVFDLRVVVVAGVARQIVVRSSATPITNLHLGNRRGDLRLLRSRMTFEQWAALIEVAEHAARTVSGSLYVGVDVLLQPGFRRPAVLELNAFGDLLPGVLHEGRDTYSCEVHEARRRWSASCPSAPPQP